MKILFIGGTGIISTAVSRLALEAGHELFLLNRGQRGAAPAGSTQLTADIRDPDGTARALGGMTFDVVVDWIAFVKDHVERDISLFSGKTGQYIFISSATVYQKPPEHYLVSESTPLGNPFWQYARDKIACEERLMQEHRDRGFAATIVRPSHTYDPVFPVAIGGWGSYTIADRIRKGKPVVVHGDGSSLWVVTHAEDFGRGFLGLFGNPRAAGQAFHITTDEVLNWNQMYEAIGGALGARPKIVHIPTDFIVRIAPDLTGTLLGDKTWSTVFDNSKIRSFVPGFKPAVPFNEGIRRTVAWFDADSRRRAIDEKAEAQTELILQAYAAADRAEEAAAHCPPGPAPRIF